jgi:hypothetical protein
VRQPLRQQRQPPATCYSRAWLPEAHRHDRAHAKARG